MAEKRNGREEVSVSQAAYMEALQQKINNYSSLLYRIAFLQLKNNQDAEDVVQETFYRLVKNRKEFETPEHEKAWLIKVTLNGCRKVWRSAWYRHTDIVPAGELPEGGLPAGRQGETDGAMEAGILEKERNREIMEAVLKLPRRYREVIHLFYFQQMSVKEIRAATGRKESTITSQLTRGRELLKKNLKEEYRYE